MAAPNAPRPSVTPAGGGAPRSLVADTLERVRVAVEALEGQTLTALDPYLPDLDEAAECLEAVLERIADGGPATGHALELVAAVDAAPHPTFTGGPA